MKRTANLLVLVGLICCINPAGAKSLVSQSTRTTRPLVPYHLGALNLIMQILAKISPASSLFVHMLANDSGAGISQQSVVFGHAVAVNPQLLSFSPSLVPLVGLPSPISFTLPPLPYLPCQARDFALSLSAMGPGAISLVGK